MNANLAENSETDGLAHFSRPYDWDAIDAATLDAGGAILEGFLSDVEIFALDTDIDTYLAQHSGAGAPTSGSDLYDTFLGHKTIRLHGLIEKMPASTDLIGNMDLMAWAERTIGPNGASVRLNAGELIQFQPGEPAQYPHRDSDSWPHLHRDAHPMVVNAIVALDDFTLENGATHVVPQSWNWEADRQALPQECQRAVMNRGDAVLFRGDLIHNGGANASGARRRAISISYCAGWIRPVENSFLNISIDKVRDLPRHVQALLGYAAHDGTAHGGGMIGLYENGDPALALRAR